MSAASRPPRDLEPPGALFTDFYQLTMMAGYFRHGLAHTPATFDLFFRKPPFGGGYAVFAGLDTALSYLSDLRFEDAHLEYLEGLKVFDAAFLDFLRGWRFTGRVTAAPEGTIVFPHEPVLSVTAPLAEAQLVETALLNLVNFETLVATKAARLVTAARDASILEFGARRAQGPNGAIAAARAAIIGGASSTSNVEAGRLFGVPVAGTHAHAWVQAFDSELSAFRAYADAFPDHCTLLLDTYDTLRSGLPNAITVARELHARGHRLNAVRLDSGDLAYLSRRVRAGLDEAGFRDVKIVASNDLDEFVIESVIREGGRIDVYGVGTQLVTGGGEGGGALGGVYKLVDIAGEPKLKLTADREKSTVPGVKRVWRASNPERCAALDVLTLEDETPAPGDLVTDPTNPLRRTRVPADFTFTDLRDVVMDGGRRTRPAEPLAALQSRARDGLRRLPEGTLRLLNPHTYRVSLSAGLRELRDRLIERLEASYPPVGD